MTIALLALLLASSGPVASHWQVYRHPSGAYSFEYPPTWRLAPQAGYVIVSTPNDDISVAVSSFEQPGATLGSFADTRFAAQSDVYHPIGTPEALKTTNWVALQLLSRGRSAGDSEDTMRLMFCATSPKSVADPVVSFTAYTDPETFESQRDTIIRLIHSVRFAT